MLAKITSFLKTDIWRIRLGKYPPLRSFFIRQLRVFLLAVRGFQEDRCNFRASALTFFSLLSIVPVIAMMFGIAKGFGLKERVQNLIFAKLQAHEEIATQIINFADSLLEQAKGGLIAGIGVVFLFWAIIKLLSNVENAFNYIWGIKTERSFGRKFSDYLSVMLICPVLLVISSSMTVMISSQIKEIVTKIAFLSAFGPAFFLLLKFLPYATLWLIFTFIFIFMPNTKVKFKSALFAGIIAGTIFQLLQWAYINFQIGVARYGAIYGSFAALPLFLIWLQFSWLVVLFGAELSFAHQNVETYEFEQDCANISYTFKKLSTLIITQLLVKNFCNEKEPLNASQISHELEMPVRLVREILFDLTNAGVLSEVRKDQEYKEPSYQPAKSIETLTLQKTIQLLEARGIDDIPIAKSPELDKLAQCLNDFNTIIQNSTKNALLKDI